MVICNMADRSIATEKSIEETAECKYMYQLVSYDCLEKCVYFVDDDDDDDDGYDYCLRITERCKSIIIIIIIIII